VIEIFDYFGLSEHPRVTIPTRLREAMLFMEGGWGASGVGVCGDLRWEAENLAIVSSP